MSRPLRIQFPGATYHVMNRGIARQKIFLVTRDYEEFLRTLTETHELWGVEVFAYCLMSSHYHVCLRTPEGNLSRVMRHVDGLYTQRFYRMHGRDGPIFRGRYKAIVIDADRYLTAVVRYIHLNPVEAGIVKKPEVYKWSSHINYLRPQRAPEWLNATELLEGFSSVGEFQEFVLSGNEDKLREFYTRGRQ
ncbi:MAG: transposase, partial [Thermodesulfobacteriota bacterium]